jgi:hypothetical protein
MLLGACPAPTSAWPPDRTTTVCRAWPDEPDLELPAEAPAPRAHAVDELVLQHLSLAGVASGREIADALGQPVSSTARALRRLRERRAVMLDEDGWMTVG